MSIDIDSLDVGTVQKIIDDQIEKGNLSSVKKFMDNESWEIRAHFVGAISKLTYKEDVEIYYQKGIMDNESRVRRSVLDSIESLFSPLQRGYSSSEISEKIEILKRKFLPILHISLQDSNTDIQHKSIDLICRIGDTKSIGYLLKLLKSENQNIRQSILSNIENKDYGWKKDANALPTLLEAYNEPDKRVKMGALRYLGLAGEESHQFIIDSLKNEDPEIRIYACKTLAIMKDPRFLTELIQMTQDIDQDVREAAFESVKYMLYSEYGVSLERSIPLER